MDFQPATAGDLAEEFQVFELAQRDLYERRGVRWTGRDFLPMGATSSSLAPSRRPPLLRRRGNRPVVGFTAAWAREDVWFLSALFVHPERQGDGIGTRLLSLVWDDGFRRRITITEALQPVSTASYARRGLIPTTPILRFQGEPRSLDGEQPEPAPPDPDALRFLDQAAYGFDRTVDHALWKETSESATLWLAGGEPAAYSYVSTTGLIGPLTGRDETSAANALRSELARHAHRTVSVAIPGSSARLVEVALAAGLRMEDPGLLLLSPPANPPRTLAIHSYWLL